MAIQLNIKDENTIEIDPLEKAEMQEAADYFKASAAAHQENAKEMRKVFVTTGIVVLALAVIVFAILAWFANNKDVYGQGMTVNAKADVISISDYKVFYTKVDDSGNTTYCSSTLTDKIRMPDYDAIISESTNTAVYFKLPVVSNKKFSSSTHKIVVTIDRDPYAHWKTVGDGTPYYMSSIMEIKCGTVPALQGTNDDVADDEKQTIYQAAAAQFNTGTDGTTFFVDKLNPSDTKDGETNYLQSLTFEVKSSDNFKVYEYEEDGTTMYKTYVYVEMDYCKDLVDRFYKIKVGTGGGTTQAGDIGEGDYSVQTFYHDKSQFTVTLVKTN